jgi:hypothetical protein
MPTTATPRRSGASTRGIASPCSKSWTKSGSSRPAEIPRSRTPSHSCGRTGRADPESRPRVLPRGQTSALQLTSVILTQPFKGPSSRREPDQETQPISEHEMSRSARLNRICTRAESTQSRSICDHRQANLNQGVDTPVRQLPRQRASGRIHRSIGEPSCARRCRRTDARRVRIAVSIARSGHCHPEAYTIKLIQRNATVGDSPPTAMSFLPAGWPPEKLLIISEFRSRRGIAGFPRRAGEPAIS